MHSEAMETEFTEGRGGVSLKRGGDFPKNADGPDAGFYVREVSDRPAIIRKGVYSITVSFRWVTIRLLVRTRPRPLDVARA
jgi:hypothetical protein